MDIEAQERAELRKKRVLVGLLFALSLVLAMVFAYWMGALGLGPSRSFYVTYDFAGGIERGSPVRLGGIRVGRVQDISFDPSAPELVRLKLEVGKDAFHKISADSKFYVNLAGLIGERYVEVVPGQGAPVEIGSVLRGVDPPRVDQLLSQGYGIFGDMRDFFNENKGDLKTIFQSLNDLSKNLNQLLGGLTKDQKRELDTMLRNFSAMSGDLRTSMASIAAATQRMEESNALQTWYHVQSVAKKADTIGLYDIRKLMLEDGMKVNFATKKVELPAGVGTNAGEGAKK